MAISILQNTADEDIYTSPDYIDTNVFTQTVRFFSYSFTFFAVYISYVEV